jgi:flagellar biosynthesis/type III secretory pathway chaperone
MDLLLTNLIGLLEQAKELYQSLLAVMQNERDAVVGLNLKKLNEACKSKDNLLLKLRILDEQKGQLVVRLANQLGFSPHKLTITKLSQLVEEPYARRLKECSKALLALIHTLQETNRHNKSLLSHSLELIKGSYNLLTNLMTATPVYYRTGNVQYNKHTGKILCSDV